MKKSTLSTLLRVPAEILLAISFLASFYLKIKGAISVSWGSIFLLLIVNISYFMGRFLFKKDPFDF